MVGGTIEEIVRHKDAQIIKVMDKNDCAWRKIDGRAPVAVGDKIWWHSFVGYITSVDRLYDEHNIGRCTPDEDPRLHLR